MVPSPTTSGHRPSLFRLLWQKFLRLGTGRTIHQLSSWLNHGLNLLFPPQCVACERIGWSLCPSCAQTTAPVGTVICAQCGRPQATPLSRCVNCRAHTAFALQMVRIAALHATPLREAIHALKYENHPELADSLARYLVATLLHAPWRLPYLAADGVIPVPLHADRQQERGYNQAELLAKAFCERIHLPLQTAWLVRQRSTQSQVGLNAIERQENVNDAFSAPSTVQGKRIILIDDVYTTGATMQAAALALRAAGAAEIYGLALACPR